MIKLLRVDHRLLHGQVAFSWTNGLGADCILVASDLVVNDEVWRTTLKLGKPAGVKLVIKNMQDSINSINSGVTDKYNLIIVVQTIKDARLLAENCESIKSINLGNTLEREATKQLTKQIFVTKEEVEDIKYLEEKGVEVEIRPLVGDKKIQAHEVL